MRRVAVTALVVSLALVVAVAAQSPSASDPSAALEAAFVEGGRIAMELSAGRYRVAARPDHRITLRWSVRDQDQLPDVEAYADIDGAEATVVMDGPRNHFRGVIEVPARSDLTIRLSAGQLSVDDIVGDKDVRLSAGELRIDVGRPEDYQRVEGSVWAGEIDAAPFGIRTGGLFRSLDWAGDGTYRLEASLRAGELHLYAKDADTVVPSR